MTEVIGVVSKIKCDKPGAVFIDDTRYGAFDPVKAGLSEDMLGKTVKFNTKQAGKYINVEGKVQVVKDGPVVDYATYGPGSEREMPAGNPKYKRSSFPIDPLDGQIAIIRQNAVTNANALIANLLASKVNVFEEGMEATEVLLSYARQIEYYTTGHCDLDSTKKYLESLESMKSNFSPDNGSHF